MRRKHLLRLALLCGALAFMLAPAARADTIYTYTGNEMPATSGTCPLTCAISATFDFSTIPGYPYSYQSSPPLESPLVSFSVTDGNLAFDNSNFALLIFEVDAAGVPTSWDFFGLDSAGDIIVESSNSSENGVSDQTATAGYTAANLDSPGTWTVTTVPEPASLLLLGTGLLGLVGVSRRRKQLG